MSAEEEFPKVLGFEILKGCDPFELKLEDGSMLRVRIEPSSIARVGNDPNTGVPVYAVSIGAVITLLKVPRELVRKPAQAQTGGAVYR